MLTKEDIKLLSDFLQQRETDLLSKIKLLIRQEIEVDSKVTRRELTFAKVELTSRMIDIGHKLKDMDISARDGRETLDLKIETFNSKLDKNHQELSAKLELMVNAFDDLNSKLNKQKHLA